MTADHEAYCATLTGLPDVCTCGAAYRHAAASSTTVDRDRRAGPGPSAIDGVRPRGTTARHLLALLGWELP